MPSLYDFAHKFRAGTNRAEKFGDTVATQRNILRASIRATGMFIGRAAGRNRAAFVSMDVTRLRNYIHKSVHKTHPFSTALAGFTGDGQDVAV